MKNLKKLVSECSDNILTNQSMGKLIGGYRVASEVITNENTDMNGDGKSDDCLYDPDPVSKDTVPTYPV